LSAKAATCGRRFLTCACSRPAPAREAGALRTLRRDIARVETRITELRKKANVYGRSNDNCESGPGNRKERVGEVISNKMTKTIVVRVERRFPHPQFKRSSRPFQNFTRTTRRARPRWAIRVRIQESRPLSKMKRWRLVEVVERNAEPEKVSV